MNKNTKSQFNRVHDAYSRVRYANRNNKNVSNADIELSKGIGHFKPLDKHPKVGRSAFDIMRRLGPRD